MNILLSRLLAAGVAAALLATVQTLPAYGQTPTDAERQPPTKEEASYLVGLQIADQMLRSGVAPALSAETVAKGLRDGLAGTKLSPGDPEKLNAYITATRKAAADRNYAAAAEFLAKNAKEKGVKTTASGLEYRVIDAGNAKAASPLPTDKVTVHYRGKLLDGTQFDSSYDRGSPATFPVNGVILGWQEALVLMKPGAKWQLWIPPALAYDAAAKPGIPAGSALVFDVELISVTPAN